MLRVKESYFYSDYSYLGWKYYNIIRKKAMEQEFSWSGLIVSLSIAFFIVISMALLLNILHGYIEKGQYFNYNSTNYENRGGDARKNINGKIDSYKTTLAQNLIRDFSSIFKTRSVQAATLEFSGEVSQFTYFIKIDSGKTVTQKIKIKNTGLKKWKKGSAFLETGPFLKSFSKLEHASWLTYYRVKGLDKDIEPGQTAEFELKLKGGYDVGGSIQENFQLVIDSNAVKGTLTRIFIDFPAPDAQTAPKNDSNVQQTIASASTISVNNTTATGGKDFCIALSSSEKESYAECRTSRNENDLTDGISHKKIIYQSEPAIRVGLYETKDAQRVNCETIFDVYGGKELLISGVSSDKTAILSFDPVKKRYAATIGDSVKYSNAPIRLVPRTANAVMMLSDYKRKESSTNPDNRFRNVIEVQFSEKTGKLWIINELPVSFYIKGLAETSNISAFEFQKTLATTAQTYALYHYQRGIENAIPDGSTKHASEHYHLDAYYDQVYRGYGSEIRMPNFVRAVESIRGSVVTYNGSIVITPYFSRSDGRTRNWSEVWGGADKPWLKSVLVPEDKGQALWGHGVGMSARGAMIMARDENKKWNEILGYFYPGTKIVKVFE
jgi:hypothetical protein